MTDIKDLLDRASDVPVTVDVASDLARGRAAVRRRRHLAGTAVAGAAVVAVAATVGLVAVAGDGSGPTTAPYAGGSDTASSAPSTPTLPVSPAHHVVLGSPVDPDTLIHLRYFEVPPAPRGWYLVGGNQTLVAAARDGVEASVDDPFAGRIVVLLGQIVDEFPAAGDTPYDFDGRTFYYSATGGARAEAVSVQVDDSTLVTVQYPRDAGFTVAQMVRYADGVRVLPGAFAAS